MVALAALAVAGCGGGSSTSTSDVTTSSSASTATAHVSTTKPPTVRVGTTQSKRFPGPPGAVGAVRFALTSKSPVVCKSYSSRLLKKSYGGIKGCRSAITSGSPAKSVEIIKTKLAGRHAVIVAVPHGGPSSKEALTISLTRIGGGWNLESIKSNVPVGP